MIIFFDIDDTLLNSEFAHKVALMKIVHDYSLRANPEIIFNEWIKITEHYLNLFFRNVISQREQQEMRINELFRICGKVVTKEETIPIYLKYHQHFIESCHVFPDTIPLLKKLQGYRMGIITNGPKVDQTKKLIDNELIKYFDPIIISEEVGHCKPYKEIFEAASRKAGELLSDCIFIGDSYVNDYLGGKNAGMKVIWLNRKRSQTHSCIETIHSLSELIYLFQ
jgi:HAD superfamily hydrolase (TIGR01549 family)